MSAMIISVLHVIGLVVVFILMLIFAAMRMSSMESRREENRLDPPSHKDFPE